MKKVETEPTQMVLALTIRQLKFIESMLTGVAIRTAAKAAGVTERTAHNWLLLPGVKAQLASGTEALLTSSRERIELLSLSAIDTLQELMNDAATPPQVRVTAARTLAARVLDAVPAQAETAAAPGIDWSQFSPEQLEIIAPVFAAVDREQQEKKQA